MPEPSWLRELLLVWLPVAGGAGLIFYLAAIPQGGVLGIVVRLAAASALALALVDVALLILILRDVSDAPLQFDPPRRGKEVLVNALFRVFFWIGAYGMAALTVLLAALFACLLIKECRALSSLRSVGRGGASAPPTHS